MSTMLKSLIVLVIIAVGVVWLVDRRNSDVRAHPQVRKEVVDPSAARQRAGDLGEGAAEAVNRAGTAVDDAAVTAKIKAKLLLDDLVKARDIDVDTDDGVVTLHGTVRSEAERSRALQLARQTTDVRNVKDDLVIR